MYLFYLFIYFIYSILFISRFYISVVIEDFYLFIYLISAFTGVANGRGGQWLGAQKKGLVGPAGLEPATTRL